MSAYKAIQQKLIVSLPRVEVKMAVPL